MSSPLRITPRAAVGAGLLAGAIALAGCSSAAPAAEESPVGDAPSVEASVVEADPGQRLVSNYDGGIAVFDAESLELLAETPLDGFTRLNPAGDGQNVFITTANGFEVYDTGATGDTAQLTGQVFEAATAGHVVVHDDRTALFDDGTGDFWIFDTDALAENDAELPAVDAYTSEAAHHGVAVELAGETVLATIGDENERLGVRQLDLAGDEISRFEQCPSVHGEGVAAHEVTLFGCQDGVLIYDDGEFTKLDSPDDFGRVGNAYVTHDSSVAFVDYRDDPDAEGSLLHRLGFVDTEAKSWQIIDLPEGVEYTWQGVERDGNGDLWLIGTDGALHQFDGDSGELVADYPVIEAWEGPAEWQEPHPSLQIDGTTAFVAEPATNEVHRIDLATGEVTTTGTVPGPSGELALAG